MHLKEQSVEKQAISRYYFSIESIKSSKESSNYNKIVALPVSMTPAMHRKFEYIREYSKKIEIITRFVYWGQEKLFKEKNQR
jgi:hypothetical protein